ncbi:Fe(2+) transporter permease subunit FeoB [Tatumella citrea]|uniref:Ferrous iron transport protein B n=1 Tax=Tatumella citrea TaxID=53336 RepID=A0A1Y0LI27_TATCI|nr:Fe(2+) transporter permease subunit FeoB [Tatumella citrea]ARU93716.1 ferrous iron transport protein B [Tatumella citrea]ARU97754.1 ferrous iron transport protein B [Tatumella citrea]
MIREPLTIALAGNPNTGKTTLFNQLTGSSQRVGNWAGVTVERKEGFFVTSNALVHLVDLPGLYSLTISVSEAAVDEQIAAQFIVSQQADVVINVTDASCLQRDLWLTLQLRATGIPCIMVLNMMDVAGQRAMAPDAVLLSQLLGCPVIPMISTRSEGTDQLKSAIDHLQRGAEQPLPPELMPVPPEIQRQVLQLAAEIKPEFKPPLRDWLAMQILEGDIVARDCLQNQESEQVSAAEFATDAVALQLAALRHQAGARITSQVIAADQARPHRLTQFVDRIAMDRFLGLPLFLLMMYLMFFLAINVGGALQPVIDQGTVTIFIHGILWLGQFLPFPVQVTEFIAYGLGGGINTVLPLVPQIGIMYLLMTFMEDSGYMARAAFVMDRLMQWLGLPGKAFVPLITGFGCNVPAVTGTRTLDSPRERLITMLMAPFMSCGARLAIFAVFSSLFFKQQGALAVFLLYLTGIVVAILTGLLLKHTLLRGESRPFVMELPLYHLPHLKSLVQQSWQRLRQFIWRAGRVIVLFSLLISGLNNFTLNGELAGPGNPPALQTVGRFLTPLLGPMGVKPDNWQATVGLITGAMAKEVVIGTLNTLYTSEQKDFNPQDFDPLNELREGWQETLDSLSSTFSVGALANLFLASQGDAEADSGAAVLMQQKFAGSSGAFCYLLFVLLYVPCASVIGAISRESQKRWMWFSVLWGLSIAWSVATLGWQLCSFSQQPLSAALIIAAVLLYNLLLIAVLSRCRPSPLKAVNSVAKCSGCDSESACH